MSNMTARMSGGMSGMSHLAVGAGAEQPQLAVRPPAEGDVVVCHEAAQRFICAAAHRSVAESPPPM